MCQDSARAVDLSPRLTKSPEPTVPNDPRPHQPARELLARIAGVLALGSLVGVASNELSGANRVSYFGFKKRDVLESRLAKSVEKISAPAHAVVSAGPLEVAFFYAECPECEIVHKRVLPEIARLFGDAVVVRKYDCADMANYKRLLEYEKRYGSDENEMLKMFVGQRRYLSGVKQIVAKSVPLIGEELGGNGGSTRES